jgi:hypothetical protein
MNRWECRYSSCEMLYLEVGPRSVRSWLHHSEDRADHWSFDDVLSGVHDAEVRALFGDLAVTEIKDAVRERMRT